MTITRDGNRNTHGQDSGAYPPCASIAEQLGLVPERVAAVIDLSNAVTTAPSRPQRPRLVHWQRTRDPMLQAWPSESGRQLEAWCPHCRTYHYHGRHGSIERCGQDCICELHVTRSFYGPCTCPPGSGDGHRSAHCPPGSPFRSTGYVVREVRR